MKVARDLPPLLLPALLAGVLVILACQSAGGSAPAAATASAPVAAFSAPSGSPVVGQSLAFTDASTGGPTAWTWSFGDGGTSTLQNPTHTYLVAGTFTVTLRATNTAGATTASRSLTVGAGAAGAAFRGNVVLGSPTAPPSWSTSSRRTRAARST